MISKEIREKLKQFKEREYLSDYNLALNIGISQNTVWRFLYGEDVTPRILEKIELFLMNGKKNNDKCKFLQNNSFCSVAEEKIKVLNQMLVDAHFQNKKLADELIITQNQYNKVVEKNKELQKLANDLEEMYGLKEVM